MKTSLLFALAATFSASSASAQTSYSLIDLGVAQGWSSQATGVNNSGVVVGNIAHDLYSDGSYTGTAFRYSVATGIMESLRYDTDNSAGPYAAYGPLAHHGTSAMAINNAGQIAGMIDLSSPVVATIATAGFSPSAVVRNPAGSVDFYPGPGGAGSRAVAINSTGQIAGWTGIPGTLAEVASVTDSAGNWATLPESYNIAYGMNDAGAVVGINGAYQSFLYNPDVGMTQISNPFGGNISFGFDINNNGWVVGEANDPNGKYHAYLSLFGGVMTDLSALTPAGSILGLNGSAALAINDAGMIVGRANPHGRERAFLYTSEFGMIDLNDWVTDSNGFTMEAATAISENGYIAGYGLTAEGVEHAFLLAPPTTSSSSVPETGDTAGLMLLAASLLVAARSHWGARLLAT